MMHVVWARREHLNDRPDIARALTRPVYRGGGFPGHGDLLARA